MRSCKNCEFPLKFARYFDWRSDGTIISTDRTKVLSRITIQEVGEFESLFTDLSNTLGMSIDRFLIQAQKNIGKALYANLPVRHMKRVPATLRPEFVARQLVKLIASEIAGLGDGIVSLDHYKAGESLSVRFENPVVIPLLVGSLVGIYESIEDMPSAEYDYGIEDGDLVVRLSHGQAGTVEEQRLYLEKVVPGNGNWTYEKCPGCGVPMAAARTFEWDMKRGVMRNRVTGEREVIIAVESVNAFLRELEKELGEEIVDLVYNHVKLFTKQKIKKSGQLDTESGWDLRLFEMALRGFGYPVKFERGDGSLTVEIEDAYNSDFYAAKLAAALEIATGKESSIEWLVRDGNKGRYVIST
jgi:hypothetical protein